MRSGNILDKRERFRLIDDSNIADHARLNSDDMCGYLFEYTSGKNYSFSSTNQLISNLKKKPSKKLKSPAEYRHKLQAISECSKWIGQALNGEWLRTATLVPVPPSKVKTDPEYDDRMAQICKGINAPFTVDVRELVLQRESIRTAHGNPDCRPDVRELLDIYEIDEKKANPLPREIGIVDDVLTAGTHFKAMQKILQSRFPNVQFTGYL